MGPQGRVGSDGASAPVGPEFADVLVMRYPNLQDMHAVRGAMV